MCEQRVPREPAGVCKRHEQVATSYHTGRHSTIKEIAEPVEDDSAENFG
jgi:hypothetical protein